MSCTTYATMMSNLVPNTAEPFKNLSKPFKSNADKLRQMTDEELAALCENGCPPKRGCPDLTKEDVDKSYHELCQKCWLDWLKQEVKE